MQNGSSTSEYEDLLLENPARSVIGVFPTAKKTHDAGLAVLAAGSPYWVFPNEGKFLLVVERSEAERLKDEVRIARMRNRFWPTVFPSLAEKKITLAPTSLFMVLLILIFYLQGDYPRLDDRGMTSSLAFFENGAWWRLFTAITLHANVGHLVGNLFGIGLFGYFSARYLGNGLAWFSILAAASLANLTNVYIHMDHAFLSLGASTAVFAALGLVTGFPVGSYLKTHKRITNRQWVIPLSGGIMLLAWLGSGDYPTDVAGHFWAFLYGGVISALIALMKIQTHISKAGQMILLALTWTILGLSWLLALNLGNT